MATTRGKLQALWLHQGQEEGELVKSVRGQEAAQVGWQEEGQQKERPVWREQERMGGGGTRVPEQGCVRRRLSFTLALGRRGTKRSLYILYINKSAHFLCSYANTVIAAVIEFKFKTQGKTSPTFLQMSTFIFVAFRAWQESL